MRRHALSHDGGMQFAGVLPEDAPDPRREREQLVAAMPIPIAHLVDQPAIGASDYSVSRSGREGALDEMSVSVSTTLWRNPADPSDPVNLALLDDAPRRALDEVPPWPRPSWLVEQVERRRYPLLWEAVQTTWRREQSERSTLDAVLVHHTNHILMNQFRDELGLDTHEGNAPGLASERFVRRGIEVSIDSGRVPGAEIDTDPFVYAVGANLPDGGILTAVIPREHLPYVRLAFRRLGRP